MTDLPASGSFVVMGRAQIDLYQDEAMRAVLWERIEDAAVHRLADERPGWIWDKSHEPQRQVVFTRFTGTEEDPVELPCLEEDALFVIMRVVVWAKLDEQQLERNMMKNQQRPWPS